MKYLAPLLLLGCLVLFTSCSTVPGQAEALTGPGSQNIVIAPTQLMTFTYEKLTDCDVNLTAYVDYSDHRPVTFLFPPMSGQIESFAVTVELPTEAVAIDYSVHPVHDLTGTITTNIVPVGDIYTSYFQGGCFSQE